MSDPNSNDRQEQFDELMAHQEPGVAQAVITFEAMERAYFLAVAATPQTVVVTSYAATTAPR